MSIWASTKGSDECWICDPQVIIAQVASSLRISNSEAEDLIFETDIDNPLECVDNNNDTIQVWTED